jgi:PKD repeat protein
MVNVTNVAPSVDAGADQSASTGQTMNFSGSFTDPGADTHTIQWNFGDGGTASGTLTPTHVYATPGSYTVTLTVTDDDGGVGVDSLVVTVAQGNRPPVAEAGGPYTVAEGSSLTVDGTGSTDPDGDTLTYAWDLDNDGGFDDAVTAMASVSFPDNGTFTVGLRVSDGTLSSTDTAIVDVTNVAPSVDAGADQSVNTGATVNFSGSFTDPGADTHTILWNFGDGGTASGTLTPTHVYTTPGNYTVTLTVTDDDGGVGIDTLTVAVGQDNRPPVAEAGGPYTVGEGSSITVDGTGSTDPDGDTLTYAWDLDNDGQFDDAMTPMASVSFPDNGTFTVGLRVSDGTLSSTDTAIVNVTNVAPSVDAGADQSVNTGATVNFSGSFADPGADTHTIEWDFGDGGTASGTLTPTHVYSSPGTYTVTLRITDDDGGVGIDTLTVTVAQANRPPVAEAGGPYTVGEGSSVTVDGTGSTDPDGDTLTYAWDLDNDGQFDDAMAAMASVSFPDNGTFTVALQVSDGVFSSTDTAIVTVGNVAPSVNAGSDQSATEDTPVSFSGSFTDPGADTHTFEWNFGDGGTASGTLTPTHVYTTPGNYTVTLTVTDDDGGVGVDTLTVTVGAAQGPIQDLIARPKDSKIDIVWTPVPGAIGYNIYRRTGAQGAFQLIAAGHVTDYAVYADFGLTNGVTYYYFVRWLNAAGVESPDSNIASGTPRSRR